MQELFLLVRQATAQTFACIDYMPKIYGEKNISTQFPFFCILSYRIRNLGIVDVGLSLPLISQTSGDF